MIPSANRVSVIITCFNQGRFLGDAVASAVARDANVEVVIVDDGSWDGTPDVAAHFPRATYIRQAHKGLAAARNRGIGVSSGQLVIFLDAPDRLLIAGIDTGLRALAERPDCGMAYGRCVMIGPDGTLGPTPRAPTVRSGHYAALLRTNLIWMPGMAIIRRAALARVGGFREVFDAAADYDLYLRVAKCGPVFDHEQLVAACRRYRSDTRDVARMLTETLNVMHENRPGGDDALSSAWTEGYRNWQDFYGTQLVEEVRCNLRDHRFWQAARKSAVLLRRAPWVFRRELGTTLSALKGLTHRAYSPD